MEPLVIGSVMRFLLLLLLSFPAIADMRICGTGPVRDEHGRIARSREVLQYFRNIYPCPATGLTTGACPGWAIDHVIPLACGGCDNIENMQWLKTSIKSCKGRECKDRWERKVYCRPQVIIR